MDTLFRRCDRYYLLRGAKWIRPGARRGRGDEQDDRIYEAVRLHLQQQMVRRHVDHLVPEQEGPIRGEDHEEPADHLLPGVQRCKYIRRVRYLYTNEIREPEQKERSEADIHALHVRH